MNSHACNLSKVNRENVKKIENNHVIEKHPTA